MATIEERMDIMEGRLTSVEKGQDMLVAIQGDILEVLKGQREEILEIKRNSERLAIIQRDMVVMLKGQQEELKLHREELQEMKRFNQQTRQMWVMMARKMDWLDEDLDIDSL